jgi:hypothetical protein
MVHHVDTATCNAYRIRNTIKSSINFRTCLVKNVNVMFVLQLLRSWEKFPRYLRDVRLVGTPGLRLDLINPLTPNDHYSGTAPLTSKRFILYIYSTNTGTACFKHGINSPFFSLQNAVCFITLTYLVLVLFTFYIQDVLKLKKK